MQVLTRAEVLVCSIQALRICPDEKKKADVRQIRVQLKGVTIKVQACVSVRRFGRKKTSPSSFYGSSKIEALYILIPIRNGRNQSHNSTSLE